MRGVGCDRSEGMLEEKMREGKERAKEGRMYEKGVGIGAASVVVYV